MSINYERKKRKKKRKNNNNNNAIKWIWLMAIDWRSSDFSNKGETQNCWPNTSGDSKNFVQDVPISFWKNFKSFRYILGRFSKYWLKFKIWPAWSLCLKKKKIVLKTKTNLHSVHQKISEEKKRKKKKLIIWFIYH